MISLNSIYGIYKLTDCWSIQEVFGQLIPVVLLEFDDDRILFLHFAVTIFINVSSINLAEEIAHDVTVLFATACLPYYPA